LLYVPTAVITSWFVDKKVAKRALRAHQLIEEEEVECRPERIPDAVVDENVDVHLVRRHFSSDAWLLIESVVKQKAKMTWTCQTVYQDLHTDQPFVCDSCLLWFHFKCVGLTRQPRGWEGHTPDLQSPVPTSYPVFCWKKKKTTQRHNIT